MKNEMTLRDYTERAKSTARFSPICHPAIPLLLGYFSYSGAVAERVKKTFRDHGGVFTEEVRLEIKDLLQQAHTYEQFILEEIQDGRSSATAGSPCVYPILGLLGESGELAGKIQKQVLNGWAMEEEDRKDLLLEVGDILWYLTICADLMGSTLEEIATMNISKLEDRRSRNVIKGEGDRR